MSTRRSMLALAGLCLLACGEATSTPMDAGSSEAGTARDAFGEDAGADAGPEPVDADSPDVYSPDAWAPDASAPDAAIPSSRVASAPLIQWVDPFIGTGGTGFNDIGSTYPGPAMPFGMIHPGPDTTSANGVAAVPLHCVGYSALDNHIRAFSHLRMNGVGIVDYTVIGMMPVIGMSAEQTTALGHTSRFDKATESASPGYYAVTLAGQSAASTDDIRVELTAGLRAAVHRYTFEPGADAVVLLDVGHSMTDVTVTAGEIAVLPDARELEGFVEFRGGYSGRFGGMRAYFVARFDRPFASHGVWQAGALHEAMPAEVVRRTGPDVGAWARFDTAVDRDVQVAIAVSFLDVARARMNLEAEASAIDFAAMRARAEAAWESELAQIELEGRAERDFRIFYTALYHALLMPTLATEADGHYRGIDAEEHVADGFTYYSDLSLWDTYRTFHPLATLLWPVRARDFVRSMMAMAEQRGAYPRWPLGTGETGGMLGDPAIIVIADSWQRGVRDFDLQRAFELALPSSEGDPPVGGRGNMEPYIRLGYVPVERAGSSVSKTMEFAYADDALATIARALGRTDDAARFEMRGRSYQAVWDPAQRFFVGRREDGAFVPLASDVVWEDVYAEGTAWQYLWLAPHDLPGLEALMGGRAGLLARLHDFFERSEREVRFLAPPAYYWQGNEPDIHAPFVFSALGDPDGAARWSSWARRISFREGPAGLPGNDDGGTMSAWYIFASLGIYPIAGDDDYLIGSPLFTRAELHLPGGDLVIEAPEASARSIYVRELSWNGAMIPIERVEHSELAAGGTLRFEMHAGQ